MDELNLTFCKLLIARVRLKILHSILLMSFTIRITTQVSDRQTHWYSQRFAPCCATFLDLNFSSQTPAEHPCTAAYQGDSTDLQKTATLALCLLPTEKNPSSLLPSLLKLMICWIFHTFARGRINTIACYCLAPATGNAPDRHFKCV